MVHSYQDVAKGLLRDVEGFPKISAVERHALEKELSELGARYLNDSELHALARLSYRQLVRLKKGKLMLRDREIVEALKVLKKDPIGC